MTEKKFKTRMQQKHDTEANWDIASKSKNPFIPLKGEIVVYDVDTNYSYERFKIGDGINTIGDLPFAIDVANTNAAYDHSITTTGNPHKVTKLDIGLENVANTGDSAVPVSGGTTKFTTGGAYTELNKKVDKTTTINNKTLNSNITLTAEDVGAALSSHTHYYAGSNTKGGAATSANKLNTNAGNANTPVYFSNGVPVACTGLVQIITWEAGD